VGEKKTVTIPSNEAYGERNEEAIIRFPKKNIPEDMKLEKGMSLQLTDESGRPIPVVVTDIEDTEVVFDANHSLAGKDLVFDIELVEIS
jgi:peptidylprolyl isomerase